MIHDIQSLDDIRKDRLEDDDGQTICDGCYALQSKVDDLIEYIARLEARIPSLEPEKPREKTPLEQMDELFETKRCEEQKHERATS